MKKIFKSIVLVTLLSASAAMAAKPVAAQFDAIRFRSEGPDDLITITHADATFGFAVLIHVENASYIKPSTGVNISNCGEIKHINQGSSVICTLYADRPPVTIASDKQGVPALGAYQVQMYN